MRTLTTTALTLLFASAISTAIAAPPPPGVPSFEKVWTHAHTTFDETLDQAQVSEIPAYDEKTDTIWVAGVIGVDVLDAKTGELVEHIDVTPWGLVNSVAIRKGLAALAVETMYVEGVSDRRDPGRVLLFDTKTRQPIAGIFDIQVGSLPDMVTFTPDGKKILVANEGTPNPFADEDYEFDNPDYPDPPGSVSIIDVKRREVIATAGLVGVPEYGTDIRKTAGMDYEPEYITVEKDGKRAFVTLQEANAIGVLDLKLNAFTAIIGLGVKNFNVADNKIDPKDDDSVVEFDYDFGATNVSGFYMPDTIANYKWKGNTYLVTANEGDFREDDGDRQAAGGGSGCCGATSPLNRLRVSKFDSSSGNLFAAGARSFSIRDDNGALIYDSGNILDKEAHERGIYDDGRSRDKGVEPEGVGILELKGRTYAFITLERTLHSAVAVFDVTNPFDVTFIDMIETEGDLAPEAVEIFERKGKTYLVITNETPFDDDDDDTVDLSHTTLYRLDK